MAVLVNNLQEKMPVSGELSDLVIKVVTAVLDEEGFYKDTEIGVIFMDDRGITGLNRDYCQIDGPTDVLSFSMLEGEPMPGIEQEMILGDVVISLESAVRQAKEYGHSFEREVAYLTAHGVLHLLGYNHYEQADKEVMRSKEEAVMKRIGLSR